MLKMFKLNRVYSRLWKLNRILNIKSIKITVVMVTVYLFLFILIVSHLYYVSFAKRHHKSDGKSRQQQSSSYGQYFGNPMRHIPYNEIHEEIDISDEDFLNKIEEIRQDTKDYLINLPGCSIPDYSKTYRIEEANDLKNSCDPRAINVKKKTDNIIIFTIYETIRRYSNQKYSCCYKFVAPNKVKGKLDVRGIRYSLCTPFRNGTEAHLREEILFVTCKGTESSKHNKSKIRIIYEDVYAFIKKPKKNKQTCKNKWNILILGMDTMSRARFYTSMPKTASYFKKYKWLDYSAYQKVEPNTFPNVMSLLTGRKMSTIHKSCSAGMDRCNDMIIWSDFKKAGYVTATGEDDLSLPDTFSKYGYVNSPTDHYLRPFFLTGEQRIGNHVCAQKKSSVKHILDYALDFAESYKYQRSLGMFWTNSYSHNTNNIPTLIDGDITNLFQRLFTSGVLNNTFVFFLSDHGIRYGEMRVPYESYYEERLPMLFLWVPQIFRQMYVRQFKSMQINQKRLITPYDLYLTFQNIIDKTHITAEACPTCSSIFKEISPHRTCADAGIGEKWCSCHKLTSINVSDSDVANSLKLSETHLQNKIKYIKTAFCTKCEILNIKTVLRAHTHHDQLTNTTFYVVAFTTTPGDVAFEAIISKHNENFTVFPIETISIYYTRSSCVVNRNFRDYCVCKSIC